MNYLLKTDKISKIINLFIRIINPANFSITCMLPNEGDWFRVSLLNKSKIPQAVRASTGYFGAKITVKLDDKELEYYESRYFDLIMTSTWIPGILKLNGGEAHDWYMSMNSIKPFVHDVPFKKAIQSGVVIISEFEGFPSEK